MGKRPQRVATLIAALVLVAGVTAAAAAASQTPSHSPTRSAVAHQSNRDASTALLTAQPGVTQENNFEFSGYMDEGTPGAFTGVSGTWRVPETSCTNEQETNTMLVSLDGHDTRTVEAVGTIDYCFEGKAHYSTWTQITPSATVVHSKTINPGDLVTATVTRTGTSFTMSLTDSTDPAQSFSVTQTCTTCLAEDAEWIAERPVQTHGVTPLAPFHWHVDNAWQTSNGVTGGIAAGPVPTEVTMTDTTGTYPLDSVSDLYRDGSGFNVRFLDSY